MSGKEAGCALEQASQGRGCNIKPERAQEVFRQCSQAQDVALGVT